MTWGGVVADPVLALGVIVGGLVLIGWFLSMLAANLRSKM